MLIIYTNCIAITLIRFSWQYAIFFLVPQYGLLVNIIVDLKTKVTVGPEYFNEISLASQFELA